MSDLPPELRDSEDVHPTPAKDALRDGTGINPPWLVPAMCLCFVLGVLWVVTYYISQGAFPIPGWGYYNVAAGMGFIMIGFFLATRWQ